MTSIALWIGIIALVLALVALIFAFLTWTELRRVHAGPPAGGHNDYDIRKGTPWVIYNPTKVADLQSLRRHVDKVASESSFTSPHWVATTREDPGTGAAVAAVEAGAAVVLVAGGDGTVRAVAAGLAGTKVPLALLPMGTGNLLARNIDIAYDDLNQALITAFTGRDSQLDLAWLRMEQVKQPAQIPAEGALLRRALQKTPSVAGFFAEQTRGVREDEFAFLVMAGTGFDAHMMAGIDSSLKGKIGWWAYVAAGAKNLLEEKIDLELILGDTRHSERILTRTILFANCGMLPGGIALIPHAKVDDGWLDIAALDTKAGLIGWVGLAGRVIAQGLRLRPRLPWSPASITFRRADKAFCYADRPHPVQVDGDLVGWAKDLHIRVQRGAIIIRTQ